MAQQQQQQTPVLSEITVSAGGVVTEGRRRGVHSHGGPGPGIAAGPLGLWYRVRREAGIEDFADIDRQ